MTKCVNLNSYLKSVRAKKEANRIKYQKKFVPRVLFDIDSITPIYAIYKIKEVEGKKNRKAFRFEEQDDAHLYLHEADRDAKLKQLNDREGWSK